MLRTEDDRLGIDQRAVEIEDDEVHEGALARSSRFCHHRCATAPFRSRLA
jgi:hypothetical protein